MILQHQEFQGINFTINFYLSREKLTWYLGDEFQISYLTWGKRHILSLGFFPIDKFANLAPLWIPFSSLSVTRDLDNNLSSFG